MLNITRLIILACMVVTSSSVMGVGESGVQKLIRKKVSDQYMLLVFQENALNPDGCSASRSAVVLSEHPNRPQMYKVAAAALFSRKSVSFIFDGCYVIDEVSGNPVTIPIINELRFIND